MTTAGTAGERHAWDERLHGLEELVRHLSRDLAETSHRLADLETEMRERDGGSGPRFASLYTEFADRFRGSTEEVTAKLAGYLPDVRRPVLAGPAAGGARVVDVGSGRGEWLAMLRDAQVPASGVDINASFVEAGRRRGLHLVHGDAVEHLQSLAPGSVDMVTAFHIIEHLDVETLLGLLEAARRALRPGGCVLLETPNPANLRMAACDFYNDPTHRSPVAARPHRVPRDRVRLRRGRGPPAAHPAESPFRADDAGPPSQAQQLVAATLFGPQDYVVLGYKDQPQGQC